VRNALRNALNRAHLHRRWWVNDADCVLLRPAGRLPERASSGAPSRLTQAEGETVLTINSMLAGSMIVSDHLPALPEARLAWLSRLLPLLPDGARVLGWESDDHPEILRLGLRGAVGEWTLVARVNWSDRETRATIAWSDLGLEPRHGGWHVVDFWRSRYLGVHRDCLELGVIPPHGTAWVAVRPVRSHPSWVGDTLHASQGALIQSFSTVDDGFRAMLAPTHPTRGMAWLWLPGGASEFRLDGTPVEAVTVGQGVYCLDLSIQGQCELEGRALRVGCSSSGPSPAEAG
jgi:alpha-galactosidase